MSPVNTAVGYVRCSTETQEDSPDQQKKEIQAYAKQNGYEVGEWFIDSGKSGTTFDQRPEFQRLRTIVDQGAPFLVVICYDESRWGRAIDSAENTYWRVYFRKQGVEVLLVKTAIDPTHEFAPLLQSLESIQASQYSKKLSELTLRGAKNNGRFSNGGLAPYGYRRLAVNMKTNAERILEQGDWLVSGQEKVRFVIGDSEEVRIVRFIFEKRASGWSYLLISKQLNKERIPCPRRGRWRTKNRKWTYGAIKSILENHSYYGARVYNRNSMSRILAQKLGRSVRRGTRYPHWRNDPVDWIVVEKAHEAIISKELWNRANSVRSTCKRTSKPRYDAPYLLTGLIRCKSCGFPFHGHSASSKGHHYYKYVCGAKTGKRVCTCKSIDRDALEGFVISSVKEMLSNPRIPPMIEQQARDLVAGKSELNRADLERLGQLLRENERAIRNLVDTIERTGPGGPRAGGCGTGPAPRAAGPTTPAAPPPRPAV